MKRGLVVLVSIFSIILLSCLMTSCNTAHVHNLTCEHCLVDGQEEDYFFCEECGKWFFDEKGFAEVPFPVNTPEGGDSTSLTPLIVCAHYFGDDCVDCVCSACGLTVHGIKDGSYCRHGDTVYFGSYPQTLVTDETLKEALGAFERESWTSYGYYRNAEIETEDNKLWMWYRDKVDAGEKYRGVYFTSYRPNRPVYSGDASNSYQDDNGYYASNVYWFKYEPVKWNICAEEDGNATLVSDLVLDSRDYYNDFSNSAVSAENDYQFSAVRQWLISEFYDTAFSASEKSILKSNADVGINDPIRLLSKDEAADMLCAEKYSTSLSGYDQSNINFTYDDCHPFFMISGSFGEPENLAKHASIPVSDSTVRAFDSVEGLFESFMDCWCSDTASQNVSGEGESAVNLICDDFTASAIIGINKQYERGIGLAAYRDVNLREGVARLFGFDSEADFVACAQDLADACAAFETRLSEPAAADKVLENMCFRTTNGYYVFPVAVDNEAFSVLTYVIVGPDGLVSVWVSDVVAALRSTNYNEAYQAAGIMNNKLYCKNLLFAASAKNASDYAKCQGLQLFAGESAIWWTCSPSESDECGVYCVMYDISVDSHNTGSCSIGVVPVVKIEL